MQSVKKLIHAVVWFAMAFHMLSASAESAAKETSLTSASIVSSIHDKLASVPTQANADSFGGSDILLAIIAGVVLIVLQLRRHQKNQSETRIINLSEIQRYNARTTSRIAKATLSQTAKPELIAHAERG